MTFKIYLCFVLFISMYWGINCQNTNCSGVSALYKSSTGRYARLIQAFHDAQMSNGRLKSYPLKWPRDSWNKFSKMMNDEWMLVIRANINVEATTGQIYAAAVTFIKKHMGANKSLVICVPIDGFGYFGDYIRCAEAKGRVKQNFNLNCRNYFTNPNWVINTWEDQQPKYCCANRDLLLNTTTPAASLIITELAKQYKDKKILSNSYADAHNPWTEDLTTKFKTEVVTQLEAIITVATHSISKKHRAIYELVIKFINAHSKAKVSRVACVPIGDWGYLGDYLQCEVSAGIVKMPTYFVECRKSADADQLTYTHHGKKCGEIPFVSDYCCVNAFRVLNKTNPRKSPLIDSVVSIINRTTVNKADYPFRWSVITKQSWISMATRDWVYIMQNPTLTDEQKLSQIYDLSIKAISQLINNRSYVMCIPINGFGYFGDLLECIAATGQQRVGVRLNCITWFDSTPSWMMAKVACKPKNCCEFKKANFNPTGGATKTDPQEQCADLHIFKCNGYQACPKAKGADNVEQPGECSGTEGGTVTLNCVNGVYEIHNKTVTSIECEAQTRPTTTQPPTIAGEDCCVKVSYTVSGTEGNPKLSQMLTPQCTYRITNNCSVDDTHLPIIDVQLKNGKEGQIKGNQKELLVGNFTCEKGGKGILKYNGIFVESMTCSGFKVPTVAPTTKFKCCDAKNLRPTNGTDTYAIEPTNFCQEKLKYACAGNHTNIKNIEYKAKDLDSVKISEATGNAEIEFVCRDGEIQTREGSKTIETFTCSSEVRRTVAPTTTTPKICCNFATKFTAGNFKVTQADPCSAKQTVECSTGGQTVKITGVNDQDPTDPTDLADSASETLDCIGKDEYEYAGTVVHSVTCS